MKKHPFFKGIDWDELYNKKVEPEFVPKIFNELDLGNFDKYFTNERLDTINNRDLLIDSSTMSQDDIAEFIISAARKKLNF